MESVTALGLEWNLMADDLKLCFVFACKKNSVITHRVVLSFASSVFDPLGFALSFTIRIRLILRLIWQKALKSWEEQIPKDITKRYLEWLQEVHALKAVNQSILCLGEGQRCSNTRVCRCF